MKRTTNPTLRRLRQLSRQIQNLPNLQEAQRLQQEINKLTALSLAESVNRRQEAFLRLVPGDLRAIAEITGYSYQHIRDVRSEGVEAMTDRLADLILQSDTTNRLRS